MTDYPNWFNVSAKDNFEKFLAPLTGQDRLRFLQLGVYTGDASVWMLKNILTAPSCQLNDVDTWEGSDEEEHKAMDFNDVYSTYIEKTKQFSNVYHYQTKTSNFLIKQYDAKNSVPCYDFIYIDADHTTVGVLMDAELSWPLLKPGGIMAFDDYTWGHELPTELAPTLGIDLFLARHEKEYKVLVTNSQVWIRKNDN